MLSYHHEEVGYNGIKSNPKEKSLIKKQQHLIKNIKLHQLVHLNEILQSDQNKNDQLQLDCLTHQIRMWNFFVQFPDKKS
ncbi:hypothetical Protein YC6258_03211 [Gynuella sunshinyii YC6258]|uniref:Uncharacterized protein n=1 Tax=Gynuella sunshinyii YC6258 TaxID=1445510 RepID=A0A0C5VKR8_9GAMM|nr:hypothetical Protein YC6258_03211 [Gynuella sunshinyii YC6258]